jgi:hypothetical protein
MVLAGVNHITIAPALLQQLAATPASQAPISLFDSPAPYEAPPLRTFGKDEAAFRIAVTLRSNGEGERKLSQVSTLIFGIRPI